MGLIYSIVQRIQIARLERYLDIYIKTTRHPKQCVSYDPGLWPGFRTTKVLKITETSQWIVSAIEKIVDAKEEEGMKLLLKAIEKSCICIRSIPIIRAINTGNLESLQLLLDNGGERNPVISPDKIALHTYRGLTTFKFVPCWKHFPGKGPEIMKCLVNAGSNADNFVNHLVSMKLFFDSDLLDVLFRNGCGLAYLRPSLYGHADYIIWLVRHGAFTDVKMPRETLTTDAIKEKKYSAVEILLHAGTGLDNTTMLALGRTFSGGHRMILQKQDHLAHEPLGGIWQVKRRREAFEASHLDRRVSDLQEFSDESLNMYPEPDLMTNDQCLQRIIDFLSQPAPLKWLCRRNIRRNMMSHCPSAVNSLPLPKPLKRYIMCHEV